MLIQTIQNNTAIALILDDGNRLMCTINAGEAVHNIDNDYYSTI
jgi:uncharacterized Zn-finger protein